MYDQSVQAGRRQRRYPYRSGRDRQGKQEQARFVQLLICLALFLAVFLGKGLFPQKLEQVGEDVLALMGTDLDIPKALSNMGESLMEGDSLLADLGAFCVEVFGPAPRESAPPEEVSLPPVRPDAVLTAELEFLGGESGTAVRTAHYADFSRYGVELPSEAAEPEPMETEELPAEEAEAPEPPPAVPAAGTVIMYSDYSGEALPNNYTMDQVSLGELETTTPVMGRLTSGYGYRDHPISGKYFFHGGIDIGGQTGDAIAAFADGVVEYTGKNDSYGLYLQIDHGNGVKSFYAHCSKIVVTKGQTVSMGEKIAEIGSTGTSTGPHLHLELKYNKMHLDPAYYVEVLEN